MPAPSRAWELRGAYHAAARIGAAPGTFGSAIVNDETPPCRRTLTPGRLATEDGASGDTDHPAR
jgi:hypothetical protein